MKISYGPGQKLIVEWKDKGVEYTEDKTINKKLVEDVKQRNKRSSRRRQWRNQESEWDFHRHYKPLKWPN